MGLRVVVLVVVVVGLVVVVLVVVLMVVVLAVVVVDLVVVVVPVPPLGLTQHKEKSKPSNPQGDLIALSKYLRTCLVSPNVRMALKTFPHSGSNMKLQVPCSPLGSVQLCPFLRLIPKLFLVETLSFSSPRISPILMLLLVLPPPSLAKLTADPALSELVGASPKNS